MSGSQSKAPGFAGGYLLSKRVYKPAFPHAQAMEMIYAERGRHFDPQVVDALLEITPEFADIAQRFRDDEVAIG